MLCLPVDNDQDVFTQRVVAIAKKRGLSGAELGRIAKLTRSWGSKVLNGQLTIPLKHVRAFAVALRVSERDLLPFDESDLLRPGGSDKRVASHSKDGGHEAPRESDRIAELESGHRQIKAEVEALKRIIESIGHAVMGAQDDAPTSEAGTAKSRRRRRD